MKSDPELLSSVRRSTPRTHFSGVRDQVTPIRPTSVFSHPDVKFSYFFIFFFDFLFFLKIKIKILKIWKIVDLRVEFFGFLGPKKFTSGENQIKNTAADPGLGGASAVTSAVAHVEILFLLCSQELHAAKHKFKKSNFWESCVKTFAQRYPATVPGARPLPAA